FYRATISIFFPYTTLFRSEIIHDESEILESKKVSSISRPYFLLIGFAIENLLKGLIVFDDPTTITSGKIRRIKTHKITNLIKEVDRKSTRLNSSHVSISYA